MNSYSQQTPLLELIREAQCLFATHRRQSEERVAQRIKSLQELEVLIDSRFGVSLRSLDVLDIGPGQFLLQMIYFARHNRVVGIDLDVIAQGANPFTYVKMCRLNGIRRTCKTIARKLAGIDRRYIREIQKRMQLDRLPELRVEQMDACRISFPDAAYDFVHSRSVFHHLPEPEAAVGHVARILRPGGVANLSFHLFTSENGSLDPRIFTSKCGEVERWPHLRPAMQEQFRANAFVNKLRLAEWRRIFESKMPGADFILNRNHRSRVAEDAESLRSNGELADYSLEELLTDEVVVLWRKPRE